MMKAGVMPAFFLLLYRDFVPGGGFPGTLGTFWHLCVPAAAATVLFFCKQVLFL